ncbi:MAG: hypothetical protein Q9207_000468 [Kuettlingeria erythrocarpa]
MPYATFPRTGTHTLKLKPHTNPVLEPYSVLVPFRTDIWTHRKRDPAPTPPTSPKTQRHQPSNPSSVNDVIERLREVRGMEATPEECGERKWDERTWRGVGKAGWCFAGCLGLRGGKAANTDVVEGWGKGETLKEDTGDEGTGKGEGALAEHDGLGADGKGEGRLKRTEGVHDLRALDKRYDPDAESAYSRTEGWLSKEDLLKVGLGTTLEARVAETKRNGKRCSYAGHMWRRRMNCWYVDVRCDGCCKEVLDEFIWVCGLPICGLEICERCKEQWGKMGRKIANEIWKER